MTLVVNPYRRALQGAWHRTDPVSADMRTQLDSAVAHFEAGAWVGGLADQAYAMLVELQRDLKSVADGAEYDCGAAYWSQPEWVEEGAWQVYWRNLIGW